MRSFNITATATVSTDAWIIAPADVDRVLREAVRREYGVQLNTLVVSVEQAPAQVQVNLTEADHAAFLAWQAERNQG